MQEFLPLIKTTLLEWAQLTLAHPSYAATVAIATGLLAAMVWSAKSLAMKRKVTANEIACVELSNNLSFAQQRAAKLQEQITQHNQQIAGSLQALTAGFDLSLPVSEGAQADALWQQLDQAIAEGATRFRAEQQAKTELQQAYQTETGKYAEKEAQSESLQKELDQKTRQIASLEQQIGQIVEIHAVESARLAELEQQTLEWLNTRQQLEALEEKLNAKESEFGQLQKQAAVKKASELIHPQIPAQADHVSAEDENVDQQTTIALSDWGSEPAVVSEPEALPANAVSESGGVAGLFKNLFGKSKQEVAATIEDAAEIPPVEAEIQPEPIAEEQTSVSFAQSQIGKIKSLLGLSKQETAIAEAETEEPVLAEAAAESEAENAGESSGSFAKSQIGKIKSLFGMAK